jgi:hypothetical protein
MTCGCKVPRIGPYVARERTVRAPARLLSSLSRVGRDLSYLTHSYSSHSCSGAPTAAGPATVGNSSTAFRTTVSPPVRPKRPRDPPRAFKRPYALPLTPPHPAFSAAIRQRRLLNFGKPLKPAILGASPNAPQESWRPVPSRSASSPLAPAVPMPEQIPHEHLSVIGLV